jgi:hypothetical protein
MLSAVVMKIDAGCQPGTTARCRVDTGMPESTDEIGSAPEPSTIIAHAGPLLTCSDLRAENTSRADESGVFWTHPRGRNFSSRLAYYQRLQQYHQPSTRQ